ncbi:LamB/YcsF family protein [Compostimonas suwonensis]|uniref:5-oxoprolinase subunit A n=1 Tax=Compostimonas suwonensis TaxID=1048394 RepID=A0A2M9BYK7_9MICO|nr:5-oxoprolinase subunit PxpA [Compostimonas suwonensis]PJJ63171.1 UPF0271 protein [Compostimonas suwonensis]
MTTAPRSSIDLNSDLGEGFGSWRMADDAALLDVVSSANIACGFHAGDPLIMLDTVGLAAERGVSVGAHVGYRDLVGFGRRAIDVSERELTADVVYQLGALHAAAAVAGTTMDFVKPHGALYTVIGSDELQARAVVEAIASYDPTLAFVAPPGSLALELAEDRGIRVVREAFADRAYTAHGTLVPRGEEGAVLHDPQTIAARVVELATTGRIAAITGDVLELDVETVCLHGDTPGSVAIARAVRAALDAAGIAVRAPVR